MSDPIITDAAREAADKEVQAFLSCRNPYVQGHHVQQLLTSEVAAATKALREERNEETARAFRLRMRAEHAEDRLATRAKVEAMTQDAALSNCRAEAIEALSEPERTVKASSALNMSDEEIEERARAGMERMGFTPSPAPATETEIDTPLTDAARFYMDHTDEELVAADFARDLERELAAAKKERDEAHIFIPCFSCLGTGEGKHDRACSTCGGRKVVKKRAGELQQALTAALRELAEERKRLDWLEPYFLRVDEDTCRASIHMGTLAVTFSHGHNLRAALDSALSREA